MKHLKKLTIIIAVTASLLFLGGCGLAQLINIINCKFSLANINNITWAGINLSNIKSLSDLQWSDLQKAYQAIKNKDFKIGCNVNVNAKNETDKPAKLCAYDYDVFLEGSSIAQGSSATQTTVINPKSTALIHVPLSMDLYGIFKNGDAGNVINLARNLMDYGNGTESNVKVKFTPYINTPNGTGKGAKLPTITLNKTFQ
jgi:LEA14-like dessication related protein